MGWGPGVLPALGPSPPGKELSETLVFDVHVSRGVGGGGRWFPVKFSQSELSRERKAKCDGRKWGRGG